MKYLKKEEKYVKTFEAFLGGMVGKNNYDGLENISKPKDGVGGEVDNFTKNKILSIKNFNKWLTEDQKAPHMVGKANKLSPAMIEDYFFDQGVQCTDKEIFDFMEEIKKDWFATFMAGKDL
jgi:hypothetical protein